MRSCACLSLFEFSFCPWSTRPIGELCELREPPQTWPPTKLIPGAVDELLTVELKNTDPGIGFQCVRAPQLSTWKEPFQKPRAGDDSLPRSLNTREEDEL